MTDEQQPDYVKCVGRTHIEHKGKSWCGRDIANEWHFTDASHLAENGAQGGRLIGCEKCLDKIQDAIFNGYED